MALSALVALLQYPCIALVRGALQGDPFYVSAPYGYPTVPGGGQFHGGVVVKVHGWMEVPMPGWMGLLPHVGLETPDNEEMESMVRGRMGLMLWWDGGPDLCSCGGAAL